jgi:hypothetical protein
MGSKKSNNPVHKARQMLSALAGSIDLSQAANTVGLTLISGVGLGEFPSAIRYLGSVCYAALEVSELTCQPIMRGYVAGVGMYPHEVLIGAHRFNTFAYDLSGASQLRFPEQAAVAMAASRMLRHMAVSEPTMPDDAVLPEFLAQVPADVLVRGADSPALTRLATQLRTHARMWPAFRAPISGQVVDAQPCANDSEMVYVTIRSANGVRHDVLLPTEAEVSYGAVQDGVYPFVEAGQQLVSSAERASDRVCEDLAWRSVIRDVRTPRGELVTVVPLRYVGPAIERGLQPLAMFEDVSALLAPGMENPAAEVLTKLGNPRDILSAEVKIQSHALATFRQILGEYAVFGTDEDLLQALASPDEPLRLSLMACIQHWQLSDRRAMLLQREDCFADLQGLRQTYKGLLRRADLVPVLQRALAAASEAKQAGGRYEEAAMTILRQYPTLCASQLARLELLGRNRDSAAAEDYLQRAAQAAEVTYHHAQPAEMSGALV